MVILNKVFNNFLKDICSISLKSNELSYATLMFLTTTKMKKLLNLTFEYGLVPVINKLTRVTKNTATAIDHIIANLLLHRTINTKINKLDISDHFSIFLKAETERRMSPEGKVQITKCLINNKTKEKSKNALQEMTWDD